MAVWINEFHYDNASTDSGEAIEVAVSAGEDVSGYSIVRYNGSTPSAAIPYTTPAASNSLNLASITPTTVNGIRYYVITFPQDGLQNGSNDGFALVNNGVVVQLLSYEGVFTAASGASGGVAAGMTSTDVGVVESGATTGGTPVGFSLQLTGTGDEYSDFTWAAPAANTMGAPNNGQTVVPSAQSLSIADAAVTEGNDPALTAQISFTVTRANGTTGTVGATWTASFGGGANDAAATDFQAGETFTGTVSFADGETSKTIVLDVQGDTAIEPNEVFTVTLTAPTGGAVLGDATATGTITNDDVAPVPVASIANAAVVEGNAGVGYLVFTVSLNVAAPSDVTIDYATSNGTASAGSDYLAVSGTLTIPAGQSSGTISVPVVGDTAPEASETLTVTLSNFSGATPGTGTATGTITNDDGTIQYFPLASGSFQEPWTNTARIATDDDWSGVPHIVGYRGDGLVSTDDADPRAITGSSNVVDVAANKTSPSGESSGGVAEFELADPTIALQGSGTADAPHIVLYMNATGRSAIRLEAELRDIDGGTDNAAQQINVQYRTDPNGAWINVPGGYFADVTTGGSATQTTALDVTLPAAADNASTLQIRIMTTNASSFDEWVGIDDIVVSSQPAPSGLAIADAAIFEGTGGTTPMSFTVTRSGDSSAAVTADYTIGFGTGSFSATAADLAPSEPLNGQVSFLAGETSKTIVVNLAADSAPEADEAFTVTLSNATTGTIVDAAATGTIVNDDGTPPLVSIADVTQAEGNAGATTFTFTVTRSGGAGAFTVQYVTTGGSATVGDDYTHATGTLSFGAGETTKTFDVAVAGDTVGELAETFGVQLFNPTGFAVLVDPNATGTIQNDDLLFIHQVQGSSYYSPILKSEGLSSFNTASVTTVVIQAVVTAVDDDGTRQGFYITEESGHWDANSLTSEGIFVMTRDDFGNGVDVATALVAFGIADLAAGHLITVSAKVIEYQAYDSLPRTMLVNPSALTVNSTGNTLPTLLLDAGRPIPNSIMTLVTPDLTDSVGNTFDATRYALSFWETVEGMLVTIPNMVAADGFIDPQKPTLFQAYSTVHADADQLHSRGGYTIAGDPPNSPPDTADADDDTIAGGRHLHDGDINPDIIEIDFSDFAVAAPAGLREQLTMGDPLGNVTGIVEFDFTDRKIFVTQPLTGFVNQVPTRETTTLGNDPRALTVATFNVENLWADTSAAGQARFTSIAQAIATNLNSPDIIMIEEIQDNNGTGTGTTDASLTWQMLVDAVNAASPGARYQWVDQPPPNNAEGGQGNGNIRVGFLYDTNRVQLGDLAWDAPIEERRKYTDRIGDGLRDAGDLIAFSDDMIAAEIDTSDWSSTRRSLLAEFKFAGNTVYLTANHFSAKGGSGEVWQFDQNLAAGEPENAAWEKRVEQANDVYAMMNHIAANAPNAGIVNGGDFNDFYFFRPLEVVTGYVETDGTPRVGGARFANLTLTLSEAERYSYTFDGRSQALDHILASQMLAGVATYDIVHLNTGFNSMGTGADADPSLSDHDPAVASFNFSSLDEVLVGTPNRDVFMMQQGGDDHVSGLGGNDTFYFGAAFTARDTVDGGDGNDAIILQGDYSAGLTFGTGTVSNITNVESISLAPGHFTDWGDTANNNYSYNLTTIDANVPLGGTLRINGHHLREGENFTFDGSLETDGRFVIFAGRGVDLLTGGAGNDFFIVGHDGRFGPSDIIDGGDGYDSVYLRGDYVIDFTVGSVPKMYNIESITLGWGSDTQFIVGGDGEFDYDITWEDSMLADDGRITINGSGLAANETMIFDGSDEAGGDFRLFGGAAFDELTGGGGNDLIYGGLGADSMRGNGGNDVFRYHSVDESIGDRDGIQDFTIGDIIDLSIIDANPATAGDDAFLFIGGNPFVMGEAGRVRAEVFSGPIWLVQADNDGDGVADLEFFVTVSDLDPITASDFIL